MVPLRCANNINNKNSNGNAFIYVLFLLIRARSPLQEKSENASRTSLHNETASKKQIALVSNQMLKKKNAITLSHGEKGNNNHHNTHARTYQNEIIKYPVSCILYQTKL